jgi:hypothetical protein
MIRKYTSPLAFKEALEQRLRDRSRTEGRSVHRLRQLVVMERLLARVFTAFNNAVLKGGMVMELRLDRARATKDLDLRLTGRPDHILACLQAAGRVDLEDYLIFEVQTNDEHPTIEADGLLYDGQRFRAEARLAGRRYGSPFGIDIAIGEPLVGEPQPILGSDALAFVGIQRPTFLAYPVTTHIAEKLHAYTVPRLRPNSRVKDLPDIALLSTSIGITAEDLQAAIHATFAHRNTHPVPVALPAPPDGWMPVYARMAAEDMLPWHTLDELVATVRSFLNPVLVGHTGVWDPTMGVWK